MCLNPQQERHERMAIAPTSFAGAAAQQRAWQVRSKGSCWIGKLQMKLRPERSCRTQPRTDGSNPSLSSTGSANFRFLARCESLEIRPRDRRGSGRARPVPTYAIAERDAEILIDFRDPPATERRASALRGIEAAIRDATTGAKSPSDSPPRKSNSRRCSSRISRNKFRVDASARNRAIERSTAMKLCAGVLGNCLLLQ